MAERVHLFTAQNLVHAIPISFHAIPNAFHAIPKKSKMVCLMSFSVSKIFQIHLFIFIILLLVLSCYNHLSRKKDYF